MDFTYSVSFGLGKKFDKTGLKFEISFNIVIRVLYMELRAYLSAPNYKETEYIIHLAFLDKLKKYKDISGIKYSSSYTDKCNIAIWDEN